MKICKIILRFQTTTWFIFLVFLGLQVSWAYAGETLRLLSFQGQVVHKTSGGKKWQTVSDKVHLQPGDVLKTGAQSKAELEFQGGIIRMYENTILELPKEVKQGTEKHITKKTLAQLLRGRSIFKIVKDSLERPFEVVTPSLIAGVKGTSFRVTQENQEKSVEVFEGVVEVSNRERFEERVNVRMGQRTFFQNGRLSDPMPFDGERGWEDWDSMNVIQSVGKTKRDAPVISDTSLEGLGGVEQKSTLDQRLTDREYERFNDLLENSNEFRREIQTGASKIPVLTDLEKERVKGDSNFITTQGTSNVIDSSEDLTGTAPSSLLP